MKYGILMCVLFLGCGPDYRMSEDSLKSVTNTFTAGTTTQSTAIKALISANLYWSKSTVNGLDESVTFNTKDGAVELNFKFTCQDTTDDCSPGGVLDSTKPALRIYSGYTESKN